ncbi:MarR family transcriptional regulator [Couchioplanes caeruleus]|uniref:MarR family winged helix-turn-helix transcriptional regulator n=1 Tax=Couchioplanes caeruleus TaxID=56438 RepID=UPI00201C85BE|nr:MarR family transcriptional regulator [Couchioplanes caeruleus]UQU62100.1 MarR family transcriptional regulator [Couchioplanes caeruleus]
MEYTSSDGLLGFFDDLVRCETRLYNALNDRLRERHGIVTSQYEFLRHLRDHPRSRVGDLAGRFAIGVGATSKGVDRLESRGWVTREPNPADRRSSVLVLTDDGRHLADRAEQTVADGLRELVAVHLGASAVTAAARSLARLRAALEADQIGTPAG